MVGGPDSGGRQWVERMLESVKSVYRSLLAVDQESPKVLSYVRRALGEGGRNAQGTVLDVGCGYGRTLRLLKSAGIEATGVDINSEIVTHNRNAGLACCSPAEFAESNQLVDVIVMSHVVEHFAPHELLEFINGYLDRLRPGGFLVIATPLASDRFFDDFDHVRPYQPVGFSMVFGAGGAQVQYRSRHRLEMVDLWFRRSPFSVAFARGLYLRCWTTRWLQAINLGGALLFRVSGGLIGRTTGWVGSFCKR
jgi:SAM-dependent methyltransferase